MDSRNGKPYGQGKMIYKDGSWYEGEWKSGLRQGHGVFYFAENDEKFRSRYEGGWKEDQFSGVGTVHWKSATMTLRQLLSHFYNETSPVDDRYDTQFVQLSNKTNFVGDFENGHFNGQGVLTAEGFINDSFVRYRLDGDWTEGIKTGETNVDLIALPPVTTYPSGFYTKLKHYKLKGHFFGVASLNHLLGPFDKNDSTEGSDFNGTYTESFEIVEKTYTGHMSEGKLHGYGEKTSKTYLDAGTVRFLFSSFILNLIPDTDSGYTIFFTEKGQWVNGEMHGYGSSDLKINDLHILYEGLFLQSKQNGLGTFKIKSTNYSVISEVSFQNGTPSGNWTTFDYNGNFFYQHVPRNSSILNFIPKNTEIKFVQVFSGDKPTNWEAYFSTNRSEDVVSIKVFPQNQTIITWGNGNRYEGDVNMNGKASFFWKDGSWYTGDFVNGIKQGYGTMSYADGDVWNRKSYVGQWSRDKESGFGTVVLKSAEQYAGKWTAGSFEGKDSTGKVLNIG